MAVHYSFDFSASRPEGVRWDFDTLAQALRRGVGVGDFLRDLEDAFESRTDPHDEVVTASAPDQMRHGWITTVYATAEKHFSRQATRGDKAVQFSVERRRLLALRRSQRARGDDDADSCMALARCSRRLRQLTRA
eukprot:5407173-Pyramimonas_sp.AAC.1